jgi:hypothetical protein
MISRLAAPNKIRVMGRASPAPTTQNATENDLGILPGGEKLFNRKKKKEAKKKKRDHRVIHELHRPDDWGPEMAPFRWPVDLWITRMII